MALVSTAIAWRLLRRWPERRVLRLSLMTAAAAVLPAALMLSGYHW